MQMISCIYEEKQDGESRLIFLAEAVGFEPTSGCPLPDFEFLITYDFSRLLPSFLKLSES